MWDGSNTDKLNTDESTIYYKLQQVMWIFFIRITSTYVVYCASNLLKELFVCTSEDHECTHT